MDILAEVVKNVLHNFSDNASTNYPPIRMTDLLDVSINSNSPVNSTYSSFILGIDECVERNETDSEKFKNSLVNALKSFHETNQNHSTNYSLCNNPDDNNANDSETKLNNSLVNNLKLTDANTDQNFAPFNNNQIKEIIGDHKKRVSNLKIVVPSIDRSSSFCVVNDLSKAISPIVEKNSQKFVLTCEKAAFATSQVNQTEINTGKDMPNWNNKQKQNRPIMGKSALLKRANIDATDSLIIHNIVLDKYNPVLNHYADRMYQRRLSRLYSSSEDDCNKSDTVFSSPPDYSPISISSVGSITHDDDKGFVFPCISEEEDAISSYDEKRNSCVVKQSRRVSLKKALSFLVSTDDVNIETSFGTTTESSLISSCPGNNETGSSDYDPEKFLNNALEGVTTKFELEMGNLPTKKNDLTKNSNQKDSSVETAETSSLLSKATSLYSSVKKTITKRRSNLRTSFIQECVPNNRSPMDNKILESLKKDLAIQNEVMFQISKALAYCRSSRDFVFSNEHIEAEKILMVASIRKEALINEINNIEFHNYHNSADSKSRGEIEISNIKMTPSENCYDIESQDSRVYYLIVAVCGMNVIASKVIEANEKYCVISENNFTFQDLSADFEICLCLYSMIVCKQDQIEQDQSFNCPSPKTIFHLHKNSKKYKLVDDVPYIKQSAFSLMGKCYIRNSDLHKNSQKGAQKLKLNDVPVHSKISPVLTAKISSKVHLKVKMEGFLTIGIENEKSCTIWNRRWCRLDGSQLRYWNYPSEEMTPSLGSVDLCYCVVQLIDLADRKTCARSKTLLLPVRCEKGVKKYLLSADSFSEVKMWEKELNFVLKTLMIWNCMMHLDIS